MAQAILPNIVITATQCRTGRKQCTLSEAQQYKVEVKSDVAPWQNSQDSYTSQTFSFWGLPHPHPFTNQGKISCVRLQSVANARPETTNLIPFGNSGITHQPTSHISGKFGMQQ